MESEGWSLFEAHRYEEALRWFERAVEGARAGDAEGRVDHERVAESLHAAGMCHFSMGRYDEAVPWFEQAAETARKGDAEGRVNHATIAGRLHEIGAGHLRAGRYDEALPWFERAAAIAEESHAGGTVPTGGCTPRTSPGSRAPSRRRAGASRGEREKACWQSPVDGRNGPFCAPPAGVGSELQPRGSHVRYEPSARRPDGAEHGVDRRELRAGDPARRPG